MIKQQQQNRSLLLRNAGSRNSTTKAKPETLNTQQYYNAVLQGMFCFCLFVCFRIVMHMIMCKWNTAVRRGQKKKPKEKSPAAGRAERLTCTASTQTAQSWPQVRAPLKDKRTERKTARSTRRPPHGQLGVTLVARKTQQLTEKHQQRTAGMACNKQLNTVCTD